MIVYFSGTGNSRFAAEYLAKLLDDELCDAGRLMKSGEYGTLHSERPWIFAAPIYAWRMANVFAEHIRKTQLSGSRDAYFVLTCGSDIGNAGKYAGMLCAEKGLNCKGVLELVMPENYIAMFRVPGEAEARAIADRAKPVLERCAELISKGEMLPLRRVSAVDKLKSGVVNGVFYRLFVKADAFYTTAACTGCGACEKACPLNNIRINAGKPAWGKNCTHCMACICGCPTEAVEYGGRSRGKPRYRCPY